MKAKRTYIILALIFISMVLIAYFTPQEVDWTPTYSGADKVPYGDYVLYERLKDIFPGSDMIWKSETPFYNFAEEREDSGANYIMVSDEVKVDGLDIDYMTSYVSEGNNVFIAAYAMPQRLADTLGIELKNSIQVLQQDSAGYVANLEDARLKKDKGYHFRHENFSYQIDNADSTKSGFLSGDSSARTVVMRPRTILGTDAKGKANFVKIPFGKGAFYIHAFPLAFTNYNMLKKDNSEYVSKCLSYLPNGPTYWDEYYKPFKRLKADTPLRFILSVPAYKWALYTAVFSMLFYMLFASKRVQRIIPIVKPPVNLSLQFTRTIGSLYYQQGDHRDIAIKKMIYLLEKIRQQYFLQTVNTDDVFRAKLANKSNVSMETINGVFDIYEREIRRVYMIDEKTLIAFNAALEKFYSESGLINK